MIPNAFELLETWRAARASAGRMLVALDFDGTLAPIADTPDQATLPPPARSALEHLAARSDTVVAIISGRALEDVRSKVGLADLYYAGNHGLEIEGPGLHHVHSRAAAARPAIAAAAAALEQARLPGVFVEDKVLSLSAHYRLAGDPGTADRIIRIIRAALPAGSATRLTFGKKVVELRPDVPWDKGQATRYLLDALQADAAGPVPALFIGDDQTDEDAFQALAPGNWGIFVTPAPDAGTHARAWLPNTDDVTRLLDALSTPTAFSQ